MGNPPYAVKSKNPSKRKRAVNTPDNKFESYLADIQYTGKEWKKVFKQGKKNSMITELTYIGELMERYKGRVRLKGVRNISPLDNDYIKFIRFAHHRIETTGHGVVAFITSNSYLKGSIHCGMREELLKSFDYIYVMNLNGISGKSAPNGEVDENVFDIQEGVAIVIAIKELNGSSNKNFANLFYYELWGRRELKYDFLKDYDINSVEWLHLHPAEEEFFFYPKDTAFKEEYETLIPLTEIFNLYKNGIQSGDDNFSISMSSSDLGERMQKFYSKNLSHDEVRTMFELTDKAGWKFEAQRNSALKEGYDSNLIKPYLYRPFDERWIFFSKRALKRPVIEVMQHMLQENLALITCKQQYELGFRHVFVSKLLGDCNAISIESREFSHYFPLYKYPETRHTRVKKGKIVEDNTEQTNLFTVTHNFLNGFVVTISNKLGYIPTPEAIFYYIYAIFHSPTYRQRYAEFLQIGFPRVPLTSNDQLFKDLGAKGQAMVDLHLMKSKKLNKLITKMGGDGDNAVTKVTYKTAEQRVYINQNQYFEGISLEVWEFRIGGYQVLEKWLKDREKAKRTLSFDDVLHYQKVVVALKETMQLMVEIDQLIPSFPIE